PPRPTAPASAPPADGGTYPGPKAVFEALDPGSARCPAIYDEPYALDVPQGVHEAWCHIDDGDVVADVYDTPAAYGSQLPALRFYARDGDGTLTGRNWTIRGRRTTLARFQTWLGGRLE